MPYAGLSCIVALRSLTFTAAYAGLSCIGVALSWNGLLAYAGLFYGSMLVLEEIWGNSGWPSEWFLLFFFMRYMTIISRNIKIHTTATITPPISPANVVDRVEEGSGVEGVVGIKDGINVLVITELTDNEESANIVDP